MVDLIKPSELDPAASVDTSAALVIDNAGQVLKATPRQVVDAGAPVPTQAEAIAGTDNVMRMTPLTTRQVLDNEIAPSVLRAQAWAESATAPDPLLPDSKSSKTWAQIATAAGEVVSITSGAGFPTRADFAVAISTGALDGLSDGQVVSAAGLQYVKKVGSTAIPDLDDWEPSGDVVYTGHFNIATTGDQSDTIRKMHVFANSVGRPVSYAGLPTVSVSTFYWGETDKFIPINTDVDFAGCKISIVDGYKTPSLGPLISYTIYDPETPLVVVTGNVTSPSTNLANNSFRPTAGVYDGSGYAIIQTSYQVPHRDEITTQDAKVAFWLEEGWAKQPLSLDMSAHGSGVTVSYRQKSARTVTISNVCLLDNGWNSTCLFRVERNQVVFDGLTIKETPEKYVGDEASVHVIMARDCGQVSFKNFSVSGRQPVGYIFSVYGGAEYFVENCQMTPYRDSTTWGCTGTNWLNGLYVKNSTIDRVDAHEFGWNFFFEDCVFVNHGCQVGRGGGTFSFTRCKAIGTFMFRSRGDYGGFYSNALIRISDCEWVIDKDTNSRGNCLVMHPTQYGLGCVVPSEVPDIVIDNVRVSTSSGGLSYCHLFGIRARPLAPANAVLYAPRFISISNIQFSPNIRWNAAAEWASFTARPGSEVTQLNVRDVIGFSGVPGYGFKDLEPNITPASRQLIYAEFDNVNRPDIVFSHMTSVRLRVRNSQVCNVQTPGNQDVWITDCMGVAGASAQRLGGTGEATKIDGFLLLGTSSPYDISHAGHVSGVVNAGNMVLPSGCTHMDALQGWTSLASPTRWRKGTGSPEGVISAPIGSLYTRTDGGAGTTLYVKESGTGNTGWVAK